MSSIQNRFIAYRQIVKNTHKAGLSPSYPQSELGPNSMSSIKTNKISSQRIKLEHALSDFGLYPRINYKGLLSSQELKRVEQNLRYYKRAELLTGVNWKLIAAVHYRESSFGQVTAKNSFQFDGVYKKLASNSIAQDAVTAAKILQQKAQSAVGRKLKPNEWMSEAARLALFYYNGPIYKKFTPPTEALYNQSPYVMNRWDEKHQHMKLYLGSNVSPQWGIDRRLGALRVAYELEQAFMEFKL